MLQIFLILGGFTLFSFFVIMYGKEPQKENDLSQIVICDNIGSDKINSLEFLKNINYQGWN